MTDYDRVHREVNQYIPDAPKMSKRELDQAILDSWFEGKERYRHASSKLAEGYQRSKRGEKTWEVKFHYGIRHALRRANGTIKKWLD